MISSFLASVDAIEFQIKEAHSNLELINVKYNVCTQIKEMRR
jgi:hypothetical protein